LGRIVDPSAREDGGVDPVLEPAINPASGAPRRQGASALETPHPFRDKLIARIRESREAQPEGATPRTAEQEKDRFGSFGGLSEELERVARAPTSSPRRSKLRLGDAPLSPNTVTAFGVVFGLAALASVFAALSHWAPRSHDLGSADPRASDVARPEATGSAVARAPSASVAPAPIPTVPPRARKKLPGPWRISDFSKPGYRRLEGKIGDQPFLKAVNASGLEMKQAYRILAAMKDTKDLNKCGRNDRFTALVDSSGRLSAFEYVVNAEEIYQAKENDKGELKGQRLDLKVERTRAKGALLISSESFETSALQSGFEPSLGTVLNRALEGHISVEQYRLGDRLRIVAQEVTVLGDFSRYAGIEAVEYLPVGNEQPIRIYYFQGEGTKGYVNAKAQLLSEGGWRKPVKNAPITSRFNPKRFHPILKIIKPHTGTDFGAPTGAPVYAALYGTVKFVGDLGPNGNYVGIQHNNGYETGYSHLSRFAEGLKVGDRVKTLDLIGYVGSTGRSTGPHLHFGVKKKGTFIDPESLHLDSLATLPAKEREAFARVKRNYDELLDAIALPAVPATLLGSKPPAVPEQEHDHELDEAPAQAADTQTAASAQTMPAAAAAPGPAASPAAPNPNRSAIYLSDKELMAVQSSNDDGESEQ
jgi:murein DD-endopeptidase MepM/ murein hydrolase activator NlpD